MKRTHFVIVGLGLLGGSLAAAIRQHFRSAKVIAISRNPRKISFAKKKKLIHEGFTRFSDQALRDADFVLICSPVDTIPKLIQETDRFAKPGTIVTDVGSTKSEIVRWAQRRRFKRIQFVGSHPLAGSHLTGVEHARADLFQGAFVFVTPTPKSSRQAVYVVSSFWKKLHASVQIFSPESHDRLVSQISHLPHVVASLLMHTVSSKSIAYAASGFLDTTRIAQGDPKLWTPIFLTNRTNLIRDLSRFERALCKFIASLKRSSKNTVYQSLKAASTRRQRIG